MKPIGTESAENKTEESAKEKNTNTAAKETTSSFNQSFLIQQYSAGDGGVQADMYCPGCGEEISGSYLPIFRCPHCYIQIWRDDNGNITYFEQKHTCPKCGHTFADLTDVAPTDFRRACSNLEQKAESVFLGLNRIVNRIFT